MLSAAIVIALVFGLPTSTPTPEPAFQGVQKSAEYRKQTNLGRAEYLFNMLRNPKTNAIPKGIRDRELAFAERMKRSVKREDALMANNTMSWAEIGPFDVSGRTRALGIDRRNSDIIIAGGASGGMWKSTDGGQTWSLRSSPGQTLGITDVVQHPSNPDTWFIATGEFDGSAGDLGQTARYYGSGLYISNDNGDTWSPVPGTEDNDVSFSSQFDYISKVVVSPTTGSLFFASHGFGVFKSTQNGENAVISLGNANQHLYADVAITSNGVLYAVLSKGFQGVVQDNPSGVYISTDDGDTWTNITAAGFSASPDRSVIGVAPSDEDVFYVFTDTGFGADGLTLFRYDVSDLNSIQVSDRSANIPNFRGDVGMMNPQGSYNLICKVLPNNPDYVFLGTTNLIRAADGFSSMPAQIVDPDDANQMATNPNLAPQYWIGGYATDNDISQYADHHPDQHNLVFDPSNPVRAFSAHDGGISVTEDITATPVVWETREEGYNVTQFYNISIHPAANDPRILGGTQDNGSPFFRYDLAQRHADSRDASTGDGAFQYLANDYFLTSSQNGFMVQYQYQGDSYDEFSFSYAFPKDPNLEKLFIHPFAVNPADEDIMAYPDGNHIWRNNQMTTLSQNFADVEGTLEGWIELNNVNVGTDGHYISALEYTSSNPSGRLYFAGSDSDLAPKIFRLDNVDATDGEVNISIPGTGAGEYVHDIVVNPVDGDEVIVVISNYEVESLWHSADAGASWTAIGGTLEGENGPSVRAAAIAVNSGNPDDLIYFAGTSVGLFATTQLNGNQTQWAQAENENIINNTVVSSLDYRLADNTLAVGTHGRGLFLGTLFVASSTEEPELAPVAFSLNQNYPNPFNPSTQISYTIPVGSEVTLAVYDLAGREVARLADRVMLSAGTHVADFDASSLTSGTYLYRITARPANGGTAYIRSRKMSLVK